MAISHGACWLPSTLTIYLLDRVLEKGLLERFFPLHEIVCKTEDLKTVVIADDPKVQLAPVLLVGRNLDKTRVPREPIHGSSRYLIREGKPSAEPVACSTRSL